MLVLSVSTSCKAASCALMRSGVIIDAAVQDDGLPHSRGILPLTDAMLDRNGISIKAVDCFAADIGPGSFTGVRIGLSAINAMARAMGKPIAAVDSLEALFRSTDRQGSVCSLIDARNGNAYASHYRNGERMLPPSPVVVAELLLTLPADTLFVGDGGSTYESLILEHLPAARFASPAQATVLAENVALAAWDNIQKGDTQKQALPLYLRPSQAERLWDDRLAGLKQS